jgi:hypothetical protein
LRAKRVPVEVRGEEKRCRAKRRAIWDAAEVTREKRIERTEGVGRIDSSGMNQPRGIVTSEVIVAV